jgi:hypothetical protein
MQEKYLILDTFPASRLDLLKDQSVGLVSKIFRSPKRQFSFDTCLAHYVLPRKVGEKYGLGSVKNINVYAVVEVV